MKAEDVPDELLVLLDRAAGRRHSRDGAVAGALAEILTRYDDAVTETTNYRALALEMAVRASPTLTWSADTEHLLIERTRRFEAFLREG